MITIPSIDDVIVKFQSGAELTPIERHVLNYSGDFLFTEAIQQAYEIGKQIGREENRDTKR